MYLFVFYIRRNQNILICYRILFSVTAMAVNTKQQKKKKTPHEMKVLIRTSLFLKNTFILTKF